MDKDRLLSTFLDLISIPAPSRREGQVAEYCRRTLEEAGCDVVVDDTAEQTGSDTGNVIATLPGTLPGKVFFDAHMDCVDPCTGTKPQIRDGVIYSDGTTVLGGDDKVGVSSIIELMRTLSESGRPHPTVVGILTVGEEVGLLGSRSISSDLFDGEPCFVLDDSEAPGTVTIGAPAHYTFTARFTGRAAHAGVSPEDGVSAIEMAASAISGLELGRLDEHTTSNIGTISGGSANNVVASECMLTGECRSLERDRVEEVRESMQRVMDTAAEVHGGEVDVEWNFEYDGFLMDEDDPTVKLIKEAAERCGLEPRCVVSGGGSDANVLGTKGCKPFVLGTGMTDFHTTHERIAVRDIEDTCRIALAIVELMGE
jgi:tripeptide aminopeptidase